MKVDALATERHYLDHLRSIWQTLEPDERGDLYAPPRIAGYAWENYREQAIDDGGLLRADANHHAGQVVLVASWKDHDRAMRQGARGTIFLEHGAGQRYNGHPNPSYSGGPKREGALLFLCPNESAALANKRAYPDVPAFAIGCPKLDPWHRIGATHERRSPVVAFGFHWDCRLCPESRWAFPHYQSSLKQVAGYVEGIFGGRVLGHGHPRAWEYLARQYHKVGNIDPVSDFHDVLNLADVYVCDNSSTLFEFASTGRPVVVLDAPWYRHAVEHGLRFWQEADVGVRVQSGVPAGAIRGELTTAIATALEDGPYRVNRRRETVERVYSATDGKATERAVAAIREVLAK